MPKKKASHGRRDIQSTRVHTLYRKARAIAKRIRYYKSQPSKALHGFKDELKSLVMREIERWKINNGK